jgi:hypothetical protein
MDKTANLGSRGPRNARVQGARATRSETYFSVRRSDEEERNAEDGRSLTPG